MILSVDADATRPCTSCGHTRKAHDGGGAVCGAVFCACLEWRAWPEDSVLTCMLRCLHLDADSVQAQQWVERLRRAHIPLEVPAERWAMDLARVMVAHGVAPQQAGMLYDPLALALGTGQTCPQTSINSVRSLRGPAALPGGM